MADLEQLRQAASELARLARSTKAEKAVLILTLVDDQRYHLTIDRTYRSVGRGAAKHRELIRETATVRERSNQGAVLYASPLAWLIDQEVTR